MGGGGVGTSPLKKLWRDLTHGDTCDRCKPGRRAWLRQRVPTIGPRSRASASSGDLLGSSFFSELAQRGSDTSEAFPKPRLPRVRRPAGPQRTDRGHVHGTGVMRREERATRCSRGRPRPLPPRGWDIPAGDGGGTGHSGCPQTPRTKRGTRSGTPDVPLPPQRRLLFKLHRPCSPASGAEATGFGAATPGLAAAFTTGRDPRAEAGQGHRWTAGWAPRAAGRQLAGPVQSTAAACPRQNVPSPARRPPCALVVPTVFHQVCLFSGVRRCHPTSPQLELSPRTAPPRVPTPESHRPAALPRRRLSPRPCCSHTLLDDGRHGASSLQRHRQKWTTNDPPKKTPRSSWSSSPRKDAPSRFVW